MKNTTATIIPFEQWLAQFYGLAIASGFSSWLMVVYIHYYATVHDCLQVSWEEGQTPDGELQECKKSIQGFRQSLFKKYRECRNIKEKAEWFDTRRPTARSTNKKYPGRWFPYIGGIRIKDNLYIKNGYDSKEEAIKVAEEFQARCGYIAYELGMPEAVEQLAA